MPTNSQRFIYYKRLRNYLTMDFKQLPRDEDQHKGEEVLQSL